MKEKFTAGSLARSLVKPEFLLPMALAFLGGWVVFLSTKQGMGISTDSCFYLEAAKASLAKGWKQGVDPTGHFPPLYAWTLAAAASCFGDMESAIRALHVFCAALMCYCLCRVCINAIPESVHKRWFYSILTLIVIPLFLGDDFIRLFALVLSEAMFMTMLLTACLLVQQSQLADSLILLLCAGLLFGLATLVRHAGLFLLPPTLLWVHMSRVDRHVSKWAVSSCFLVSICLPIVANKLILGAAGTRALAFHWPDAYHWNELGQNVASWLVPYRMAFPVIGWIMVPCLTAAYASSIRRWLLSSDSGDIPTPDASIWAMGSALFYLGMVLLTVTFLDFDTPLDYRLLFPFHVFLAIFVVVELGRYSIAVPARRKVVILGLFVWCTMQSAKGLNTLRSIATQGIGLKEKGLQSSSAIGYLRNIPETIRFVSNKPEVIHTLLGRQCDLLPEKNHRMTMKSNERLDDEMRSLRDEMKAGRTLLVWVHGSERIYIPEIKDIEKYVRLESLQTSDEKISIYKAR